MEPLVYFVSPELHEDIRALVRAGKPLPPPEECRYYFRRGINAWVLQTYRRLAHAGYAVELVEQLQPGKINFTHYDFLPKLGDKLDGFIVAARAIARPSDCATFRWCRARPTPRAGPRRLSPTGPSPTCRLAMQNGATTSPAWPTLAVV